MTLRFVRRAPYRAVLCGAAWLACAAPSGYAQYRQYPGGRYDYCPPPPCAPSGPATLGQPVPGQPPQPYQPQPSQPQPSPQAQPSAQPQQPEALPQEQAAAAGGETFAAAFANGGYIDPAIPRTMFRLRFEAGYRDNRPDRAEFFYAKCGCLPGGRGPTLPETSIDYQEVYAYGEYALGDRFSVFLEVPWRFLNPEVNDNANGFSDLMAGFKFALIADPCQFLTFQFKAYAPTGDSNDGLGTGHTSLEPGLLYYRRLGERLTLEAELRDWIPVGGTDFAGNVLRYGVGLGYDVWRSGHRRLTPIVELVGWTVLSGKESNMNVPGSIADASGDTIVNAKVGVRYYFGERSDVYVGYGRALTGEVWYKDIIRAEYRLVF
jgi:hypothetical protein